MTDQSRSRRFAFFLLACLFAFINVSHAQDSENQTPSKDEIPNAPGLLQRQQQVADSYKRLEELLIRLADVEASTNPERASLLRRAARQSSETFVLKQLESATEAISNKQFQLAIDNQSAAQKNLAALLKLLLTEDRQERIRDEKEWIKRLKKDMERQLRRQIATRSRTERNGDLKSLEEEQEGIADKTKDILSELDESANGETDTEGKQSEGKQSEGKQSEGKQSEGKQSEGKQSEGKQSEGKQSEGKQSRVNSPRVNSPRVNSPRVNSPRVNSPRVNSPRVNSPRVNSPRVNSPRVNSPRVNSPRVNSPRVNSPRVNSPRVNSPRVNSPRVNSPRGKQSEGKQSEGKQSEGKQSEGKQSEGKQSEGKQSNQTQEQPKSPQQSAAERLRQAQQRMREAQEQLEQAKRDKAVEKQREAEQQIRKAIDDLERILRQLREEERERELARLEARFRKMAEMQAEVYENTRELSEIPPEARDRSVDIRSGNLAFEEKKIVLEADRAMLVLKEEGSSVAFPEVVDQMRSDMQSIADRLANSKIDIVTQGLEEDVLAALEEMIAALQQAQRELEEQKSKPQQPQQQRGAPGEKPLVEPIAELKLIRTLEKRIKKTTERYAKIVPENSESIPEDILELVEELSARQLRLYRVTRDIVLKKNR